MMSGNNFFLWQARTLDTMDSMRNSSEMFTCECDDVQPMGLDDMWNHEIGEIREDCLEDVECSDNFFENLLKGAPKKEIGHEEYSKNEPSDRSAGLKEIRMQEIEEIILKKAVFRNIDGNLCVWNGRYYRQLDSHLFAQEVRKLMSETDQKRISRFGRFRETYEYMLANEKLKKQFSAAEISASKHMIVFQNGMYDAENNKLVPWNHKYPVLFDINANYIEDEKVETPCMDSIINRATQNDKEVLKRFYQCLGYIYSQGNDAKKFFIFGTAPDSGKSIIGEFIAQTLGEENVSTLSLNDFSKQFALGTINQKVLNYNMDLPANELGSGVVQKLKQLTGDVRIDCEEKYVQGRTVVHHCKFLFATNHSIRLKQEDEAFYNRLVLIPFMYSVEEADKDYQLLEKLWQERDAIATRAAHAYRKLYKNNYIFAKSSMADDMLSKWKGHCETSFIKEFFYSYFEDDSNDSADFMPTDVIFTYYQKYCKENGRIISESEKPQFSKKFRQIFRFPSAKRRVNGYSSPVNGYIGIRLKQEM